MNDRDIEHYLASLEGGWLSEDDMEKSDEEGENVPGTYDRDELLNMLESDEEDTENPQNHESDPPLVENEVMDNQVVDNSDPTGHIFSALLDKRKLIWKKKNIEFDESKITFKGNSDLGPELSPLDTPYACFNYFFSEDFMARIVEETNLYATQKNPANTTATNLSDLRKFFGILIYMSVQHFPNIRAYWSPKYGYEPIYSVMSNNRFEQLKKILHFNNNDHHKAIGDPGHDRLFKIRPVIDELNSKFSSVPMDQRLSIDEQMCATKVAHFLKQYLPNKPHKWGFKLYVLCSLQGFAHNFEVYAGQDLTNKPENEPDLGSTSNIVLRLARGIPRQVGHIVYFDNFYTSVPLVFYLATQGILSVGTVQQNRIPNSKLPDKKQFMNKSTPRGAHEERVTTFQGVDMSVVAWKDNKVVTLLSSYVGALPLNNVSRYDKKKKEKIQIPCPKIISEYNAHMGGVDHMDSFLGRYRIRIKSRKWYIRIFYHLLDLAVINAWIIYKKNAKNVPKKDILNLGTFRNELAFVLCNMGAAKGKKGRPSSSLLENEIQAKKKRSAVAVAPPKEVCRDGQDHWPLVGGSLRCKYPNCKGYSTIHCSKCNINLCLNKNNNCFSKYHNE